MTFCILITYLSTCHILPEPKTASEALQIPEWEAAMSDEFQALLRNNTWELVPHTSDMNVVGCKWVFKTKLKADGTLLKYKARLVAKGLPSLDYFDTFSLVVKPATIRIILSLDIHNQWDIQQIDINNAFLNGELT
ncbi:uncharacterized protein LOC116111442 [Pistacia vera]|uniref:uncharacterized protein LOC116111442 n=1 Tax=Pistacia vera TaxID=55513 RepID=UPI0012638862|nr:uncharacterized protein LOC116111442 [Pistacia vera]